MSEQKQRIIFDIPTKEITPFRIRVVMSGESYGRDDCLTHEGSEPLVEFFDKRFPHTPNGQFVSRYYLETVVKISDGLNLDGGVDAWKVSKEGIDFVQEKLKELIPIEVEKYTQPKVSKPKMR